MSGSKPVNWEGAGRQQPLGWWGPLCLALALAATAALGVLGEHARERLAASRRDGDEAAAIEALRAIANAQTLYREGDKDGDGVPQYADRLSDLIGTGAGRDEDLIDAVLARGVYSGYVFDLRRASGEAGQHVWYATASPLDASQGRRHFGINMSGQLFERSSGPVRFDARGDSADPALTR